jgi:hypothetical protein
MSQNKYDDLTFLINQLQMLNTTHRELEQLKFTAGFYSEDEEFFEICTSIKHTTGRASNIFALQQKQLIDQINQLLSTIPECSGVSVAASHKHPWRVTVVGELSRLCKLECIGYQTEAENLQLSVEKDCVVLQLVDNPIESMALAPDVGGSGLTYAVFGEKPLCAALWPLAMNFELDGLCFALNRVGDLIFVECDEK